MKNINTIFLELDNIAYLVKENNSYVNYDLVYEGFWDTVKSGANKIKSGAEKVGKFAADVRNTAVKGYNAAVAGIDYVKELGQQTWDKIKQLGEDFVEWVKEVKEKTLGLIQDIKELPAKAWDKLVQFWSWIGSLIDKIGDKLSTGWDTFKSIMNTFVFTPIAEAVKNILIDLEVGMNYSKLVISSKYMDAEAAMSLKKQVVSEKMGALLDVIIEFFKKVPGQAAEVGKFLANLGKGAVVVVLGLIILPFILAKTGGKYLYNLGDTFLNKVIEVSQIKYEELKSFLSNQLAQAKEVGTILKEVPASVKKGYEDVEKVPVRENYKYVLSFDKFNNI